MSSGSPPPAGIAQHSGAPRQFKFFDSETFVGNTIASLEIACATSGRTHMFFGDPMDGRIRVFDRTLRKIRELDAYPNGTVTHLKLALAANKLFSIGDESREHVAVLQQWDLNSGARVSSQRLFHPEKDPAPSDRAQLRFNYNPTLKLQLKGNSSVAGEDADAFAASQATSDSLYSCVVDFDVTEDGKQFALALANGEVLVGFGADRGTARTRRFKLKKARAGDVPVFVGFPQIASPQQDTSLLSRFAALGNVEVAWPYLFVVYKSATILCCLPTKLTDPIEECVCLSQPPALTTSSSAASAGSGAGAGAGGTSSSSANQQQQPLSVGANSADACFIDHQQLWIASPLIQPGVGGGGGGTGSNNNNNLGSGDGKGALPSSTNARAGASSTSAAGADKDDPDRLPERPQIPVTVYNPLMGLDPRLISSGKLPDQLIGQRKTVLSNPDFFEGEKLKIGMHRGYVFVLSHPDPVKRPDKFHFTLLDEDSHIRAVVPRDSVHQNVAWILPDQSDILLILQEPKQSTVAQKIVRFSEVNMQSKLDQLFRKEFYGDALKIVQKQRKNAGDSAAMMMQRASGGAGSAGTAANSATSKNVSRSGAAGATLLSSSSPSSSSPASAMLSEDELLQQEVEMRYGDHLFTKGRFSDAIDKYISAIRRVDPSVVIRKFLDVHRIADLTKYLEALHRKDLDLANENHTTLLVNCYAKLKDEKKLQEFIDRDEFTFDARNAIAVCRQANYYEPAKSLAKKYREHGEYINILLDNTKEFQEAVRFIKSMSNIGEAWKVIADRGKLLIDRLPKEATECFRELLCQGVEGGKLLLPSTSSSSWAASSSQQHHSDPNSPSTSSLGNNPSLADRRINAASFIPLFVDTPFWLHHFLKYIVEKLYMPNAPPPTAPTLNPNEVDMMSGSDRHKATEATATNEIFNTLLELLVAKELPERLAVGTTMLVGSPASATAAGSPSLGASLSSSSPPPQSYQHHFLLNDPTVQPESRRRRALDVLQKYNGHYDAYHALVLAHQNNFAEGVLLLLQQLDLHGEVFGFYAKIFEQATTLEQYRDARQKLEETCLERQSKARSEAAAGGGAGSPSSAANSAKALWVSFLALLLRADASRFTDVASDVTRVLQIIASEDLLPPVAVIELLSTNARLPLRAAKQYVLEAIQRQQRTLEGADVEVHRLEQLNTKVREDLVRLSTTAQVFQATKCTQCGEALELPAVHFLCRHAYHKRCLNDPRECNECGLKNRRLVQRRREQEDAAADHEAFFAKLSDARAKTDLFTIVAQQFGMGVFSATTSAAAAGGAGAGKGDGKQKDAFDSDDEDENDDDLMNDRSAIEEREAW